MSARIPDNEEERLKELMRCGLLDTPPDPAYDRITRLATRVFNLPTALVTLVDRERQWFKSTEGFALRETSREDAFCAHTILEERAMLVPDTREDNRFVANRFVVGMPRIRFYAGAPLITPKGYRIGTVCVMDTAPRADFGERETAILEDLAAMVVEEMKLRSTTERSQIELNQRKQADRIMRASRDELELRVQQRTADLTEANAALREAEAKYRGIFEKAFEGIYQTDANGILLNANPALARLLGHANPQSMIDGVGNFADLYAQPGRRAGFLRLVEAEGFATGFESQVSRLDGSRIWISENAWATFDARHRVLHYEGTVEDVSSRRAAEEALLLAREELESRVRERTAQLALVNGDLRLLLQEREVSDGALRRSEAKFRAMIENAQDLITILDPRGVMLYQSPSVEHVFDFKPEDLVGRNVFDYVHPEDRAAVAERMERILKHGESYVRTEARLLCRDGGWRLVESVGSRTPPGSPIAGLVVNSRDITERRRTEDLHAARNRQQSAIAELSRHALQGLDLPAMFDQAVALATATLGIRVASVNELLPGDDRMVIRSGLGFAPGVVGEAVVESWRPARGQPLDHRGPVVIEHFERQPVCHLISADALRELPVSAVSLLIQGDQRPFGTLCAMSDGTRSFSGEDITFLQTMADLLSTAILRRRNEEALRETQARYQRIVANTPGMVHQVLIRADGSVAMLFASEECRFIYGVEPRALYDHPNLFWEMVHPEDRPRLFEVGRAAQVSLEPIFWEGRVVSASGAVIDVSIRSRPERMAHGDTIWDGVVVDISELKSAQAAMQAAKEEAERANDAKSEFLSRMSHELRTPLNAILGFGQLLEMERLTSAQSCSVEQILRGGRHLLDLINEVLDVARIESGHFEFQLAPVPVGDLLEETIQLIQPLAEARRIRFEAHPVAGCCPEILADRARLSQVLLNLLSNAIKYNHEGGSVIFGCEDLGLGQMRLSITDTGPGLTAAQISRIFTPFERLDAARRGVEGTGIGLAISRSLVRGMGGSLDVASVPGQGCAFSVTLPRAITGAATAEPERRALATPPAVLSPPRTVLHIEDQRVNRELVERALGTRPGVRLLESMDGESGVMRARIGRPDLILLDLHLPDFDGEEVLRRLRADPLTAEIPVVVLTADATPARRECLRQLGVGVYLTKPLDMARFLHVLDEAFAPTNA